TNQQQTRNRKSKITNRKFKHMENQSQTQTSTPTHELQTLLTEVKSDCAQIKALPETFKTLQDQTGQLQEDMTDVRRLLASRSAAAQCGTRPAGRVSDQCARHIASAFILHCDKSDKLDALCSLPPQRDALMKFARQTLGVTTRNAITTGDVP